MPKTTILVLKSQKSSSWSRLIVSWHVHVCQSYSYLWVPRQDQSGKNSQSLSGLPFGCVLASNAPDLASTDVLNSELSSCKRWWSLLPRLLSRIMILLPDEALIDWCCVTTGSCCREELAEQVWSSAAFANSTAAGSIRSPEDLIGKCDPFTLHQGLKICWCIKYLQCRQIWRHAWNFTFIVTNFSLNTSPIGRSFMLGF